MTATDVASSWIELSSLLNNAYKWTFETLSRIKTTALLPVMEFHSDNGSEFINCSTERWRKDNLISFTRSRDHKKNDNCFVEQKNGAVVREYVVDYDRLEGIEEQSRLSRCSISSCPLKSLKAKLESVQKKSRFTMILKAHFKGLWNPRK